MELGQKIRAARLEQGLSQRQLCGDVITRNMLSQIENGNARPSMDTLAFLAERLGKSVSFFLEEQPASPNQSVMERARLAFSGKDFARARDILSEYRENDPVFDWEKYALQGLILLELARDAADQGKKPYALHLLREAKDAGERSPYFDGGKVELALAKLGEKGSLPDVDEVLMLKAQRAIAGADPAKAAAALEAMDSHAGAKWQLLRGQTLAEQGQWEQAKQLLLAAEEQFPEQTAPLLEKCFSALEDYKMAYYYACKQR